MPDPIRVLAVDDDPDVLELTATFLARVGDDLTVETAVGGTAGEDALRAAPGRVDCVVSDYDMPDVDGLEFLRTVREAYPGLPFILFTGKGSEEIASEAIAAGVTDYLQKVGGREQYEMLANRIENAVERRRAEQRAADLSRINGVIRRVQAGLVAAETREEIEALVCEEFANANPYAFAWVGEPGDAGALEPRASSGDEGSRLADALDASGAVTRRRGPGAVAARTGEPQAVQDVMADPGYAPWRDVTRAAGLHSLCAVPLSYGDADYGALVVYASRPYAFDDEELSVLAELGDTIGRAIDAVETSRALDFVNELVEGVESGVGAHDSHGTLVYANSAYADMLGYEVTELVGTPIWEVTSMLTADTFESYWASFDPDETRVTETGHVRADGEEFPVETTTTHVEIGGERYHVGTVTDISQRIEHRTELEEVARRFEAVFDDPGAFIGLLEPDGTVMQVNQTAKAFADVTDADVMGQPFWETAWWAHSGELQERLEAHVACAADGEFVRFEVESRGRDGSSVTLDTTIRPVRDGDGEGDVVALLAEGRNITDRKHLERELRRSNDALQELYAVSATPGAPFADRLQDVLETGCSHLDLEIGALTTNADDDMLDIVGIVGETSWEPGGQLRQPVGYDAAVERMDRVFAIDDVVASDWETTTTETYDVSALVGGNVYVNGEHYGMLWFASRAARPDGFSSFDRTFVELLARWASRELEHQAMNQRLERQNERLDRFASIVTHDLRSPMNAATGWLDLVHTDHPDDDRLARVESALERMDAIIDDVRSMARHGSDAVAVADVVLPNLVEAAWGTASEPGASLHVGDLGTVRCDEGATRQLLENLFRNAVEHAGCDVAVTVDRTTDGFFVADDGPGIPPTDREQVLDHGYTTAESGTGFGLSIVQEVADAHGWSVAVTASESGGARFDVSGVEHTESEA